jgi:hypothetical protein
MQILGCREVEKRGSIQQFGWMVRQFDGARVKCMLSGVSREEVARGRSDHYSVAVFLKLKIRRGEAQLGEERRTRHTTRRLWMIGLFTKILYWGGSLELRGEARRWTAVRFATVSNFYLRTGVAGLFRYRQFHYYPLILSTSIS